MARAVLVTGASTGIGEATALRLKGAGWEVYAGARKDGDLERLREAGLQPVRLDVTDPGTIAAARSELDGRGLDGRGLVTRRTEDPEGLADSLGRNRGGTTPLYRDAGGGRVLTAVAPIVSTSCAAAVSLGSKRSDHSKSS